MRRITTLIFLVSCSIVAWSCNLADSQPPSQSSDVETAGSDSDISDTLENDVTDAAPSDSTTDTEPADTTDDAGDTDLQCQSPQQRCGNECIDTSTSVDHCGDCNLACAPPENTLIDGCVSGDCRYRCQEGYFDLNDDIFSDGCESACGPNATESCGDGTDNDCDGEIDEDCRCDPGDDQTCGTDEGECERGIQTCSSAGKWGSCDGQVTGSSEVCNGLDDDCDGNTDENVQDTYYADDDGDGYGDSGDTTQACSTPSGYTDNDIDCDDSDENVNPGASESCNGIDDDCDGAVDEGVRSTFYVDQDGDGYGDPGSTTEACTVPSGYVDNGDDCHDGDPDINPGEDETCNGVDDDCDNDIDEGVQNTYYRDLDGDGYGDLGDTTSACSTPSGYTDNNSDCDDGDGDINPGENESCNGVDDDCDNDIDEGVETTYYHDGDGDSFGDPNDSTRACSAPANHVSDDGDCDDSDENVNPGRSEICNSPGTDYDCDGQPACGDPDCDEDLCQTSGGAPGYCVNQTCVEGGSCNFDTQCSTGLQCNGSCCCPSSAPCPCVQ